MKAGEAESEEVGGEGGQREKAIMKTLDGRLDRELRNPHGHTHPRGIQGELRAAGHGPSHQPLGPPEDAVERPPAPEKLPAVPMKKPQEHDQNSHVYSLGKGVLCRFLIPCH